MKCQNGIASWGDDKKWFGFILIRDLTSSDLMKKMQYGYICLCVNEHRFMRQGTRFHAAMNIGSRDEEHGFTLSTGFSWHFFRLATVLSWQVNSSFQRTCFRLISSFWPLFTLGTAFLAGFRPRFLAYASVTLCFHAPRSVHLREITVRCPLHLRLILLGACFHLA